MTRLHVLLCRLPPLLTWVSCASVVRETLLGRTGAAGRKSSPADTATRVSSASMRASSSTSKPLVLKRRATFVMPSFAEQRARRILKPSVISSSGFSTTLPPLDSPLRSTLILTLLMWRALAL